MFTFIQSLEIDYSSHIAFVAIGIIILKLSSMKYPGLKLLPSSKNLKLFVLLSLVFVAIQVGTTQFGSQSIVSLVSREGLVPVILLILFEGVFVGWTEEFLFRGCIQRTLSARFPSKTKLRISYGTVFASLIFGAVHMLNLSLGQSLPTTAVQVSFAVFFGLLVGWFYEKKEDLAAAAWIHNINDFLATVIPFI